MSFFKKENNKNRDSNNRQYTNGEITVYWRPAECIHSTICYRNLIEVFNPAKRPWVNMSGASSDKIIDIVKKCPTNALTYTYNNGNKSEKPPYDLCDNEITVNNVGCNDITIEIIKGGPLVVNNNFKLIYNNKIEYIKRTTYFCRCGKSGRMPFCDGNHSKIGFKD